MNIGARMKPVIMANFVKNKTAMRKSISCLAAAFVAGAALNAQSVYNLYDGPAPGSEKADYPEIVLGSDTGHSRVYNVTVPTLTVFRPEEAINTGAAVLIAPGGGNMYLTWEEEGVHVAQWFQRHGITGIVLKYRTNYMGRDEEEIRKNQEEFFGKTSSFMKLGEEAQKNALKDMPDADTPIRRMEPTIQGDDGRAAVKFVRAHAAEWGVDPRKVALIGFSAGAGLTMNVMYFNDEESRPDLVAPIYGISGGELPEHPVPIFIAAPEFDLGAPRPSFELYEHFQKAHLPAELHFIHEATHGEGLLYNGKEWNEWIYLLYNFMKAVGFIE